MKSLTIRRRILISFAAILAVMDGLQLQWIYDHDVDMRAAFDVAADSVRATIGPAAAVV